MHTIRVNAMGCDECLGHIIFGEGEIHFGFHFDDSGGTKETQGNKRL